METSAFFIGGFRIDRRSVGVAAAANKYRSKKDGQLKGAERRKTGFLQPA